MEAQLSNGTHPMLSTEIGFAFTMKYKLHRCARFKCNQEVPSRFTTHPTVLVIDE